MLPDEEDYTSYFEDTMRAYHYENNRESVDIMIRQSRPIIEELLRLGVRFEQNEDGSLRYAREEDIPVRESAFIRILLEKK